MREMAQRPDRTALVTGGTGGLGRVIAAGLAESGVHTCVLARKERSLREASEYVEKMTGAGITTIAGDLTDARNLESALSDALRSVESFDMLVHLTGGPPLRTFAESSENEWHRTLEMNFHSLRRLLAAVLPGMIRRRWGRVLSVSSLSVKEPHSYNVLSATGRLPAVGLLAALARQYGRDGVTFNTICPGPFDTPRMEHVIEKKSQEQGSTFERALNEYTQTIPVGRLGEPRELASLCLYLLSEDAGFMTGQVISLDGGLGAATF